MIKEKRNENNLKKKIETQGEAGEITDVAAGYARNYLIPKGFAIPATRKNLTLIDKIKDAEEKRLAKEKEEAEMIMKQIEKEICIFFRLADENGHLYGSVSEDDIVEALAEKNLSIEKSSIILEHHLKELGEHTIKIKLKDNIQGNLKIKIEQTKKKKSKL